MPDSIKEARERVEFTRDLEWTGYSLALEALKILEQFEGRLTLLVPTEGKLEFSANSWGWMRDPTGTATVDITLKDQEDWAAAVPFFDLFEEIGFPLASFRSTEDAKNFARTYEAMQARGNIRLFARLTIALREGNTGGCRRILVGRKKEMVEVEKEEYKLVCDGGEQ